jgi:hypothetical protein
VRGRALAMTLTIPVETCAEELRTTPHQ